MLVSHFLTIPEIKLVLGGNSSSGLKGIFQLLWFCVATLCDWLKKVIGY